MFKLVAKCCVLNLFATLSTFAIYVIILMIQQNYFQNYFLCLTKFSNISAKSFFPYRKTKKYSSSNEMNNTQHTMYSVNA